MRFAHYALQCVLFGFVVERASQRFSSSIEDEVPLAPDGYDYAATEMASLDQEMSVCEVLSCGHANLSSTESVASMEWPVCVAEELEFNGSEDMAEEAVPYCGVVCSVTQTLNAHIIFLLVSLLLCIAIAAVAAERKRLSPLISTLSSRAARRVQLPVAWRSIVETAAVKPTALQEQLGRSTPPVDPEELARAELELDSPTDMELESTHNGGEHQGDSNDEEGSDKSFVCKSLELESDEESPELDTTKLFASKVSDGDDSVRAQQLGKQALLRSNLAEFTTVSRQCGVMLRRVAQQDPTNLAQRQSLEEDVKRLVKRLSNYSQATAALQRHLDMTSVAARTGPLGHNRLPSEQVVDLASLRKNAAEYLQRLQNILPADQRVQLDASQNGMLRSQAYYIMAQTAEGNRHLAEILTTERVRESDSINSPQMTPIVSRRSTPGESP